MPFWLRGNSFLVVDVYLSDDFIAQLVPVQIAFKLHGCVLRGQQEWNCILEAHFDALLLKVRDYKALVLDIVQFGGLRQSKFLTVNFVELQIQLKLVFLSLGQVFGALLLQINGTFTIKT